MVSEGEYFNTLTEEELWKRYCGFLDLSLQEFMQIQEHLLLEQLEEIRDTILGKKIMGGQNPATVADFRRLIPLTTYDDYKTYLSEKREDVLVEKPYAWLRTSGRSGSPKWIPYTERFYNTIVRNIIGALILACATKKGEVNLELGERMVSNLPPAPYASGGYVTSLGQALNMRIMPPLELAGEMDFQERIDKGFTMALRQGVDIVGSLGSVLLKIGEAFTDRATGLKFSTSMLYPTILYRVIRAIVRSKLERRGILPKDLWQAKGIVAGGADTTIYRDKITHYWGKEPYELYSASDVGIIAIQSWTKNAMTFLPFFSFFEFIPEEEVNKNRDDNSYQPSTVLLDELKEGECYEIVATNFHGLPFLRYRSGDLIQIVTLRDNEAGIDTPQMVFKSRADDIIDLASFTRLDERTIWQAINNTGVQYKDWTIRKEYIENQPILHLYIEMKQEMDKDKLGSLVHDALATIDPSYNDMDTMLELKPVKVTLLSPGTFERYYLEKQAEGVDLAYLKPPHVNPRDSMIELLLRLNKVTREE
jgi:phenylacetate-coenzyme A ligase PaaK-like adenylate-forming protein